MLALAKLDQSEEVAGAGACASWERSTSKCERAPAALNQFAPADPRHAARRSFRSLSGAQQRDYVNVFEGFIAKKEAKEVLGQAVKSTVELKQFEICSFWTPTTSAGFLRTTSRTTGIRSARRTLPRKWRAISGRLGSSQCTGTGERLKELGGRRRRRRRRATLLRT